MTPPSEVDFIIDHFFDLPDVLIIIPFVMLLMITNFMWTDRQERARRRRIGRCLACGYDLRGEFDDGCPECGWNRATPASK